MDKALAFKGRILNKENLNPKTWIKTENIKGFKDFILQKESEETDGQSFDDENMCKYICNSSSICIIPINICFLI